MLLLNLQDANRSRYKCLGIRGAYNQPTRHSKTPQRLLINRRQLARLQARRATERLRQKKQQKEVRGEEENSRCLLACVAPSEWFFSFQPSFFSLYPSAPSSSSTSPPPLSFSLYLNFSPCLSAQLSAFNSLLSSGHSVSLTPEDPL